jgi:hypothetical protein
VINGDVFLATAGETDGIDEKNRKKRCRLESTFHQELGDN